MQHYLVTGSGKLFEATRIIGKKLAEKGERVIYKVPNNNDITKPYIVSCKDGVLNKIIERNGDMTTVYDKTKGLLIKIKKNGDMFTREVTDAETGSMKGYFSVHKNKRGKIDIATFCTSKKADSGKVSYAGKEPNWYNGDSCGIPIKTRFRFHNIDTGVNK